MQLALSFIFIVTYSNCSPRALKYTRIVEPVQKTCSSPDMSFVVQDRDSCFRKEIQQLKPFVCMVKGEYLLIAESHFMELDGLN